MATNGHTPNRSTITVTLHEHHVGFGKIHHAHFGA